MGKEIFSSTSRCIEIWSGTRGFSFLSLVAVLIVAGILYLGYFNLSPGIETPITKGRAVSGAGRAAACKVNRESIERALLTWSVRHPETQPSLTALEREGIPVASCPEGGQFRVEGSNVLCSIHD